MSHILTIRRTPSQTRLVEQDGAGGGLNSEIQVGPADEFEIDERREGSPRKVFGSIIDAESPSRVIYGRADRIILQPVYIESAHSDSGDWSMLLAIGDYAANDPGSKSTTHRTPIAIRDTVFPDRYRACFTTPPHGANRGDRKLYRRRRIGNGFAMRNSSAITIYFESLAAVFLAIKLEAEVALLICF